MFVMTGESSNIFSGPLLIIGAIRTWMELSVIRHRYKGRPIKDFLEDGLSAFIIYPELQSIIKRWIATLRDEAMSSTKNKMMSSVVSRLAGMWSIAAKAIKNLLENNSGSYECLLVCWRWGVSGVRLALCSALTREADLETVVRRDQAREPAHWLCVRKMPILFFSDWDKFIFLLKVVF